MECMGSCEMSLYLRILHLLPQDVIYVFVRNLQELLHQSSHLNHGAWGHRLDTHVLDGTCI